METTALALWGKVVTKLRQKELTALYTACGDVRDVTIEHDKLIVSIEDEYLYKIIAGETNINLLQMTLAEVDKLAKLEVVYSKPEDYVKIDLETLRRKFGNTLKIKEN